MHNCAKGNKNVLKRNAENTAQFCFQIICIYFWWFGSKFRHGYTNIRNIICLTIIMISHIENILLIQWNHILNPIWNQMVDERIYIIWIFFAIKKLKHNKTQFFDMIIIIAGGEDDSYIFQILVVFWNPSNPLAAHSFHIDGNVCCLIFHCFSF